MSKLQKSGVIKKTETFDKVDISETLCSTDVPIVNIALGGKIDGGLTPGSIMIAGPSKHFKSLLSLVMVKGYLDKYEDAVCIFYDTEYGISKEYLEFIGIDPERVLHIPAEDIETVRNDFVAKLNAIEDNEHAIFLLDSLGNAASSKELADADAGKSASDMGQRAKAIKSFFRTINVKLVSKKIPFISVNHTYDSMELFPKKIVSGGQGAVYNANVIFIIGRRQVKEGSEVIGYDFIINIEKSRYVVEKSSFPISVTNEEGIAKYSGIFDIAIDAGIIDNSTKGWYSVFDDDNKYRRREIETSDELMDKILHSEQFKKHVEKTYKFNYKE